MRLHASVAFLALSLSALGVACGSSGKDPAIQDGSKIRAYLVADTSGSPDGSGASKVYTASVASDGRLGAWQLSATTLPTNAYPNAAVANGKLYVILGRGASVYASTIASDGALGPFSIDSALPVSASAGYQAVLAGSTYYLLGNDACDASATAAKGAYYAATGGGGPLSWAATTALPVARLHAVAAAPGNGYLYVSNGFTGPTACTFGTADGRTFFARIGADGSLGAWSEASLAAPAGYARSIAGVATANGFIYVAGGAINAPAWDGSVWFMKPNADGTLGAWAVATHSIDDWIGSAPVMAAFGGHLYVGGGFNTWASPKNTNRFYRASLDPTTGQPGPWTRDTDLPSDANTQGALVFHSLE